MMTTREIYWEQEALPALHHTTTATVVATQPILAAPIAAAGVVMPVVIPMITCSTGRCVPSATLGSPMPLLYCIISKRITITIAMVVVVAIVAVVTGAVLRVSQGIANTNKCSMGIGF